MCVQEPCVYLLYAASTVIRNTDLVQIPNYSLFLKTRTNGRGGGVGFYIHNSFHCKTIAELSPFVEKEFESLTVELTQKKKKLILCNIYRSPTQLHGQSSTVQIDNFQGCGAETIFFRSGSGSGSDFQKVSAPAPAPAPEPAPAPT